MLSWKRGTRWRDTRDLQENINALFTPEPQFCCRTARIQINMRE
jgi:hypothetical protein